jgi:transcriptional regulator with XRE-family HTH domain
MEPIQDPRALLRAARKAADDTQAQAAEKLKPCSEDMLGMIERGDRAPGLDLALRIHDVYGVPPKLWGAAKAAKAAAAESPTAEPSDADDSKAPGTAA